MSSPALVRVDRREDFEHLAAEARNEPSAPRVCRDCLQLEHGRLLVGVLPEMEGHRQALQLDLRSGPRRRGREVGDLLPPALGVRVELEPVRPGVHDAFDGDPLAHVFPWPSADDGDEPVARHESL